MEWIVNFVKKHENIIKDQTEGFALSVAYFTGAILCFKYTKELYTVPPIIAGLFLLSVSVGLLTRTVDKAQQYVEEEWKISRTLRFSLVGGLYTCTIVCTGFSLLFKAIGV